MISAVIDTPDRCTLYINGDYFQQLKSVKIPAIEIGAAMIGGWNREDSPDKDIIRTLSGRIDELAIFTKALITKDIKDIYETGEPGDFPAPRPSASYLRWQAQNRELQQRQDLVAYYDFQAEGNNDKVLVNRALTGAALNGEIQNAAWTQGRFAGKKALEFMAADAGVKVQLPDKYQQVTFITWINIDRLANNLNGLLLSNDWSRPGQVHWELSKDAPST